MLKSGQDSSAFIQLTPKVIIRIVLYVLIVIRAGFEQEKQGQRFQSLRLPGV